MSLFSRPFSISLQIPTAQTFDKLPHEHQRHSALAHRSLTTMGIGRRRFLCWMLPLALAGCQKLSLRSQNPDEDDIKLPETQFIKDQVTVSGLHAITIEAVGLVSTLDGTGGDPPPSTYRSLLVEDMKKRGVTSPNTVLQDPRDARVLIR